MTAAFNAPQLSLQFDEPSHTYTLDGAQLPSVTTVLSFGKDLSRIPRYTALFGTLCHKACELDTLGELDEDSLVAQDIDGHWLDPWPRLHAWRSCRKRRANEGRTVRDVERPVWGEIDGLRFAGMIDVVWSDFSLSDLKSGQPRPSEHGPQVAAYGEALRQRSGMQVPSRDCIYLGDGRSDCRRYNEEIHLDTFISALRRWYSEQ